MHLRAITVKKENVDAHIREDQNGIYNYLAKECIFKDIIRHNVMYVFPDKRSIREGAGGRACGRGVLGFPGARSRRAGSADAGAGCWGFRRAAGYVRPGSWPFHAMIPATVPLPATVCPRPPLPLRALPLRVWARARTGPRGPTRPRRLPAGLRRPGLAGLRRGWPRWRFRAAWPGRLAACARRRAWPGWRRACCCMR